MNKIYAISCVALITMGAHAQKADNFTAIKGNTVVSTHKAASVTRIKVENGILTGVDSDQTTIFTLNASDLDKLSFEDVAAVDKTIFTPGTTFDGWQEIKLDLVNGQELELLGIEDAESKFQKHFFEVNGDKATFKGLDGSYTLYYKPGLEAFYLENRDKKVADGVIWLFGQDFGHAAVNHASAGVCTWATPADVQMANKVADGVYEVNAYLGANFTLKFFHQIGRGGEYGSLDYIPYPTSEIEAGWSGTVNGHFTGDYVPGKDFVPGVYTIYIDTNKKFVTLLNEGDEVPEVNFNGWSNRKVNGVSISQWNNEYFDGNTVWGDLNLTQGQEMTFEGFAGLEHALSPDFFEFRDGKIYFKAPASDKQYRMYFSDNNKLFYTVHHQDLRHPDCLWLRGWGIAHPSTDGNNANFADPNGSHKADGAYEVFSAPKTAEGVYEATLALGYLGEDQFQLRVFDNKWEKTNTFLKSGEVTIVNGDDETFIGKTGDTNFGIDDYKGKFTRGTYHVKIDTTTSPYTVTFTKVK